MKKITIKKLVLDNFKCHKHLNLSPNGKSLSIYGDNAAGKSSIYDGLTWLLFGKDSHGNGEKNIDIKPLDADGKVADHQAITSVEAVLDVDGTEIALKRSLREVWTTKRGSLEATYDGNSTEYTVDGVPCKAFEYNRRVGEIVPEDVFRLLTSVSYFGSELDWRKRRKALFDLAHINADADIMGMEERYKPLADAMGNLTLEDLCKKLGAKKRGLSGIRTDTPARIEECQKTIASIGSHDYDDLRKLRNGIATELDAENTAHQALSIKAFEERAERINAVQRELTELEAANREHRAKEETLHSTAARDIHDAKAKLASLYRDRDWLVMEEQRAQRDISNADAAIASYRAEWVKVKAEAFAGGNCPTCGQPLPIEQLTAATERFEAKQRERLDKLVASAENHKNLKKAAEKRLEFNSKRLEEIKSQIAACEVPEDTAPAVTDLPGYLERRAEIMLRLKAAEQLPTVDNKEHEEIVAKLTKQISDLDADLSTEAVLHTMERRIDELRETERAATEELEEIEKLLWLAEDFIRYKTTYIEDNINGMFQLARFRLFREQANGGVEERCDVTYNGIPYMSLNSGARINVGVDIINALSRGYGYAVPLVIDNAESVTSLEFIPTQTIRLVVSENDKELRIVHEN